MEQLRGLQQRHACITEVRGAGLMIGCELDSADLAKTVAADMLARHIILNRTSDTVLRFLPPYILERKHVDIAIAALDAILTSNTSYAGHAATGEHAHG
jgi:acetylornithine aminotransferase/acetylornithine/N-succinyldiaminopimelate aminotransferase